MHKVIIADDEPLTRYALRKIVSQNFPEFLVIDEVDNGIDVMKKAEELKPDLIFMDIKMPGINGIDASEKILLNQPKIHIIILTAYDHFNYIQKALEIGVEGYLLKPISKEATVLKIKDIIQRIDRVESKEKERQNRENNIEAVIEMAKKDLIDQIVQRNNEVIVENYIQFLEFKAAYGYFMCLEFDENTERLYNSSLARERKRMKVINSIDKYLPFMTKYILGSPMGNRIIIFIYDIEATTYDQYEESKMIAEHLIHKLAVIEHIKLKIGIGQAYKERSNYRISFLESFQTVKSLKQEGSVHFTDINENIKEIKYSYPLKAIDSLKEKIILKSSDECYEVAHSITKEICYSGINIPLLKEYLIQFCYDIRGLLVPQTEWCDCLNSEFIGSVLNAILLEELEMLVNVQLDISIACLIANGDLSNQTMVQTIYDYINQNYKNNISLDDIAVAINKSSQYTSKLFKELFKVNFIDYLTQKRVEEAKRLLRTSHMRIKEISTAVGYEDSNYFCRMFKKNVGVTPKIYKKNNG